MGRSVGVVMPNPAVELLTVLRAHAKTVLADHAGTSRRLAYVNYPNHGNAGDPALWLGGLQLLEELGHRIVYQCEPGTYDVAALRAADPDAIVINGGGNLGDRYPRQQKGREAVLSDCPDIPTLQLPQSIHFSDLNALARMQRLVADHHDLTLLVRDQVSLERAERWFDAPVVRCPDLAFALAPRSRADTARCEVLWLARGDKEAAGYRPDVEGLDAEVTDWLGTIADEPAWSRAHRWARTLNRRLTPKVAAGGAAARRWGPVLTATYRPLAAARVLRGMRILARGHVVVTDRLHGHVLCLLQGIEHVVLDNADGKVRALYEADTHPASIAHLADDAEQARRIVDQLLRPGGAPELSDGRGTPPSPAE